MHKQSAVPHVNARDGVQNTGRTCFDAFGYRRAACGARVPTVAPRCPRSTRRTLAGLLAFVFLRCHDFAIFSEHNDESLIRRGRQTSERNRSFAILRERVGARYTYRSSQLRRVSSFEFRMQVPGWRSENRSGGPRFAGWWLAGLFTIHRWCDPGGDSRRFFTRDFSH